MLLSNSRSPCLALLATTLAGTQVASAIQLDLSSTRMSGLVSARAPSQEKLLIIA